MHKNFDELNKTLPEAVRFHGHLCPGLMIGCRVALLGLSELEGRRSEDEELVAIVENDSCAVDGIQFFTGCTFGKGNLIFRDWGKQVFTFISRSGGPAVRLCFKGDEFRKKNEQAITDRNAFIELMKTAPDEDLFKLERLQVDPPAPARIFKTIICESCGEGVMETRTARIHGRRICLDCLFKGNPEVTLAKIADFVFETGMLKKTPRTGYQFLGHGRETVAEHCFRAAILGFILAGLTPKADRNKVVNLCLFHDLPEARTGDLNYVNKQYVLPDELRAGADAAANVPCGPEIEALLAEFNRKESLESLLAHDADQLDMVAELKEKHDLGNGYAANWLVFAGKRIKTEAGRSLFEAIVAADWTGWWFDRSREDLWVRDG